MRGIRVFFAVVDLEFHLNSLIKVAFALPCRIPQALLVHREGCSPNGLLQLAPLARFLRVCFFQELLEPSSVEVEIWFNADANTIGRFVPVPN